MNILFLSQRVPQPPDKGDKIRSHHLMRRIAARHAVHVVCLLDDPGEEQHAVAAERWAASVTRRVRAPGESARRGAARVLRGRPISSGWFVHGGLARLVRERLAAESFDVAVAYCSSMAPYLEGWDGPRVLDLVDVDSEKWRQYAERSRGPRRAVYALEHRLLRRWEARLVREFDRSVLISAGEREALGRFADVSRVDVVPNGVDVDWLRRPGPRPTEPVLVFVGALDYFANVDGIVEFVREAWPAVRRRVPGARLRVVGRRPAPEVRALAGVEGVEVVGEVPDVRPEVWGAAVAVVPLRIAQGLQNKVLEAMAAGVPVVSAPAAVRAVAGVSAPPWIEAETAEDWAEAVGGLLADPSRAEDLAGRARALVETGYSWDRQAAAYEEILAGAGRRADR